MNDKKAIKKMECVCKDVPKKDFDVLFRGNRIILKSCELHKSQFAELIREVVILN